MLRKHCGAQSTMDEEQMRKLTIELSEEQAKVLSETAKRAGVAFEEMARELLADSLDHPRMSFQQAAEYVLKKNKELYRRLAHGPR